MDIDEYDEWYVDYLFGKGSYDAGWGLLFDIQRRLSERQEIRIAWAILISALVAQLVLFMFGVYR